MQIPWPRKGDRLFKIGGYRNLRGWILSEFSIAAVGYKEAADILIEVLAQRRRDDSLVLPIVFCYRQYIELRLKALTETIRVFTGDEFKRTHDLTTLWSPLRERLLDDGFEEGEQRALAAVDTCIAELNGMDPGATVFRYPTFTDAKRLNYEIDLGNLKSVIGRLSVFLDALQDYWEDYRP